MKENGVSIFEQRRKAVREAMRNEAIELAKRNREKAMRYMRSHEFVLPERIVVMSKRKLVSGRYLFTRIVCDRVSEELFKETELCLTSDSGSSKTKKTLLPITDWIMYGPKVIDAATNLVKANIEAYHVGQESKKFA